MQLDTQGRAWLDAVSAAVLILREDKILYANPAAEALLGHLREILLQMLCYGLPQEASQPEGEPTIPDAGMVTLALLPPSGEVISVTASVSPIVFDGEQATLATVTGRKSPGISLATFRQVIDSSRDMFFFLRPERNTSGEIVEFICEDTNRRAEAFLSTVREQVVGAPVSPFVPIEYRQMVLDRLRSVLESGEPFDEDLAFPSADGTKAWFHFQFVALADRLAVFVHEVTARKRLEEKVQANEALYRALFDNLPDITTLVFDHDLHFLAAHGSLLIPSGYNPDDLVGRTVWDVLREPERLSSYYQQALAGTKQSFEWELDDRIYHVNMVPIRSDDGAVVAGMTLIQDITERKRLEREILSSEQRLRKVLQNMPVMIDALTEDYIPLVWNRECERVTGYSAAEMIGNPRALELLYPDPVIRKALFADWEVRGNTFRDWEWDLTAKDGTVRTVAWSSIADEVPIQGWPIWSIGVDVTERKQAEQALREREERYRITSELISDYAYSYRVRADGEIEHDWITDSFVRVTGYTYEEIDAKGQMALYHPDDLERVTSDLTAVLSGEQVSSEYRIFTKNGELHWLLIERRPVWDEAHERVVRFYGVAKDITERKQAEEAVRQSEARYRSVFEGASMGIIIVDQKGYAVAVNPTMEQMLGYTAEELQAMPFAAYTYEDDVADNLDLFGKLTSGEIDHYRYEKRYVPKHGELIWVRLHVSLFPGPAHDQEMVVALIDDITQQKQMETQALELAVEREKVKMLGNFVRDVSHDLKTPLSILTTHLYLMTKSDDPAIRARRIHEMEEQVVQLGALIDQLLTMTRLDVATEFAFEPVDMNLLIETIARNVRGEAEKRGLTLSLELDASRPVVEIDEARIDQALDNMIDNAIQFTPDGGTITLRTYVEAEQVVVEIQDTGVGIEKEDLPFIFDRFYRADKARPQMTGGAGLGLTIARKIVDVHGGVIEVETEVNRGSTFRLRLPVRQN